MKRALLIAASLAISTAALDTRAGDGTDIAAAAVLLVARPALDGSPFHRAAIVAAPFGGGHVGVVLNRPLWKKLGELFPDDKPSQAVTRPVHFGGLYKWGAVMAMVRAAEPPAPSPKAIAIVPGVWLVLENEMIDEILRSRPNEARYYAGIIVWEEGVLREQIDAGRLAVARRASAADLFLDDTSGLHEELSRELGGALKRLSY